VLANGADEMKWIATPVHEPFARFDLDVHRSTAGFVEVPLVYANPVFHVLTRLVGPQPAACLVALGTHRFPNTTGVFVNVIPDVRVGQCGPWRLGTPGSYQRGSYANREPVTSPHVVNLALRSVKRRPLNGDCERVVVELGQQLSLQLVVDLAPLEVFAARALARQRPTLVVELGAACAAAEPEHKTARAQRPLAVRLWARCCDSYVARPSSRLRLDHRRAPDSWRSGATPTTATPWHTCLFLLARMLIGFGFCPHIAHTALSETVTCWESQLCDFAAQGGCNPLTCNVTRSPKAGRRFESCRGQAFTQVRGVFRAKPEAPGYLVAIPFPQVR
jgi:hypothetical protein